ncbi:hypothetical protein AQI88_31695 [Streptomyces cellostaticus]|uniref:DUF8017 domain-containing protein n=1 Tax=Streptomyces cellostaticus TaxID=67285 RepID=A0A101NFV6_9ACTN|nr:hypothetical protein [Streptomyces cellostaticus]KUM92484.1 hypothetical protein AQI88_31695 [Streptomyces cellostaticus]
MWPGQQQPPGGEQNPQNNPYQQPGYQQPNPYQQPGYQQPGPYAQQPQWGAPAPAGAPQPSPGGGGGGGNRTKVVAIVAAAAVVVAAGVTAFLVLGNKDKKDEADKPSSPARSSSSGPSASASGSGDDPRSNETDKPTIAGWKVVVNPKWGVAFDVPSDWEVQAPGVGVGFDFPNSEKDKGITMSGLAQYKSKWCTSDDDKDGRTQDTPLAVMGTKGASGAKNTDEIAINTPAWWVYGGYTMPDKKSISWDKKATPFKTTSGIEGSYAWAQSTHTPRKGKCVTDGKALTFGFQNSTHDYVSFNFYGATGVKGEMPKATVLKILSTVRLNGTPTND